MLQEYYNCHNCRNDNIGLNHLDNLNQLSPFDEFLIKIKQECRDGICNYHGTYIPIKIPSECLIRRAFDNPEPQISRHHITEKQAYKIYCHYTNILYLFSGLIHCSLPLLYLNCLNRLLLIKELLYYITRTFLCLHVYLTYIFTDNSE